MEGHRRRKESVFLVPVRSSQQVSATHGFCAPSSCSAWWPAPAALAQGQESPEQPHRVVLLTHLAASGFRGTPPPASSSTERADPQSPIARNPQRLCCLVNHHCTPSHGVLRSPTGSHGVLQGPTGSHGVPRGPTGSHGVSRGLHLSFVGGRIYGRS